MIRDGIIHEYRIMRAGNHPVKSQNYHLVDLPTLHINEFLPHIYKQI